MTKQEKIQILAAQFEVYRFPREEGETNAQYVARTTQEQVAKYRIEFLERALRQGIPQADIDVSEI